MPLLWPSKTPPPGFLSASRDKTALVTGSSGLCGARLVELLLERGTRTVIAFDLAPPDAVLQARMDAAMKATGGTILVLSGPAGDLTNVAAVDAAFQRALPKHKVEVVYHIAALVGPFFDRQQYFDVNVDGTNTIIAMCRKHKVSKLVYSSSPGTRFTGPDICGLTEDDLPIPDTFLAVYAETKAIGEIAVKEACSDDLLTVSVAPHQIYGPHDKLFLAKFLETAGQGRLRIFGTGEYDISVCYVDNYAHGLMCGADALYPGSPALGQFYIITDGGKHNLWQLINEAAVTMGFDDMTQKFYLPVWFMCIVATFANVLGVILQKKFKLNYFSLRMITMHRYFDIRRAMRDLQYAPVKEFADAWPTTLQWFKTHWLPAYLEQHGRGKRQAQQDTKKTE